MSTELAPIAASALVESVVIAGDLAKLQPAERVSYYRAVCDSLSLNPLTKPFEYITLNGKLTLYATKNCTDQLRSSRRISIQIVSRERLEDLYVVTARASLPDGRTDESIGAVSIGGLKGDALANGIMKAETKAKRRATLSLIGLSLDESELETIPNALPVAVNPETGEIFAHTNGNGARQKLINDLRLAVAEARKLGLQPDLSKPAEMSDVQLADALSVVKAMIDSEYAAVEKAA